MKEVWLCCSWWGCFSASIASDFPCWRWDCIGMWKMPGISLALSGYRFVKWNKSSSQSTAFTLQKVQQDPSPCWELAMMLRVLSSLCHHCPSGRDGVAAHHECHWQPEGIWRGQRVDTGCWATVAEHKCPCRSAGVSLFCLWNRGALSFSVILTKLQTQARSFFPFISLPKRDPFHIFPLHMDFSVWGICRVSVKPCQKTMKSGSTPRTTGRGHTKGTEHG